MVDLLVHDGAIRTDRVEQAVRAVPRHLFVPEADPADAYRDRAISTKTTAGGQPMSSLSQPSMVVAMLEQLAVQPGDHVLEIGTGTGYNAALLAHLAGATGTVTTIDVDPDLVVSARRHLDAAGAAQVSTWVGDGAAGWPDDAPYGRIMVTVAAPELALTWTEQLADGGRLVVPLSRQGTQASVAFDAGGDQLVTVPEVPCRFVSGQGGMADRRP
jgi:protein-L-isoaspartate(D-aspartate) O-methyltransferase